jgi:hypothetical protein
MGLLLVLLWAGAVSAENGDAIGQTPPRLSFVDGQVSFWRPGAQEWVQAQVNTALAPGDQLYAGPDGNFELQIGSRAFVRGAADTQIGLESHEPDFLQFKMTTGHAAFDLRSVAPGRTVEVDTPNAAFTINVEGYYRIGVKDPQTTFTTRRGGQADAAPAAGAPIHIGPNETVVLDGTTSPTVSSQPAVPLDSWDQWNYDRTGRLIEAASARYVAPDTYGLNELDRYGTWRTVPTYGPVWRPNAVSAGWVPYSTGSWMRDPYYGWTWVDAAPWGWAPYHYGRWVHVNGYWCWAPGPRVLRPVYAPALVAFYGVPGAHVSVNLAGPSVGWVSLGWGEPLIPWWGRTGFIHRPWWGGWAGPRCINNRVVHHTTVVHAHHITHYHNTRISNAMVVVDRNRFGRGPIRPERIRHSETQRWRPLHAAPAIAAVPESYVPNTRSGRRPSDKDLQRPVVRTRPARQEHRPDSRISSNGRLRDNQRTDSRVVPALNERDRSSGQRPANDQRPASPSVRTSGKGVVSEPRQGGTGPDRPKFESPRTPRKPDGSRQPIVRETGKPPAAGSGTRGAEPRRIERMEPIKAPARPDRPAGERLRTVQPPAAPRGEAVKGSDARQVRPQVGNPQKQSGPERRTTEAPRVTQPSVTPKREAVKSYGQHPAASPAVGGRSPDRNQYAPRPDSGPARLGRPSPNAVQDRSGRPQGMTQPRVSPQADIQVDRVSPSRMAPGGTQRMDQGGSEARKKQIEDLQKRRSRAPVEAR